MKKLFKFLVAVFMGFALVSCTTTESLKGVSLNKEVITLVEGETATLEATIRPEELASETTIVWSTTNAKVATVDDEGVVTAIKAGTAKIKVTATRGAVRRQDTCTVKVLPKEVPVTGVTLDKQQGRLDVGESIVLTPTVLPEDATNKDVTWSSSNEEVAAVNGGVVTALSVGNATITVTTVNNSKTASFILTVYQSAKGVSLNEVAHTMEVGDTFVLTATVDPEYTTNKEVTWASSNPHVAAVNNGHVTAYGPGNAIITVTTVDGNYKATCFVSVVQPVTGVTLDASSLELVVNEETTLVATVLPSDATNKEVTWVSSNPSVAKVNDGTVKALAPGNAVVSVITLDGQKEAKCTITVTQPVNGVELNENMVEVELGDTFTLEAKVYPTNATNKEVKWTSSNEDVATIIDGEVHTHGFGNATIIVETLDGKYKDLCLVTVTRYVDDVTLNHSSYSMNINNSVQLEASILPEDAQNTAVTWTSSDDSVAFVNNKGLVVGLKVGNATITATTKDGNHKATCLITVEKLANEITSENIQVTYGEDYEVEFSAISNKENAEIKYYRGLREISKPVDAGVYKAIITVPESETHKKATLEVSLVIEKRVLIIEIDDQEVTYGDDEATKTYELIAGELVNNHEEQDVFEVVRSEGNDADTYEIYVEIINDNYIVLYESAEYVINPKEVEKPVAATGLVYNNELLVGVEDNEGYSVEDGEATNADTYIAYVSLDSKQNYVWEDGTTDDLEIEYVIALRQIEVVIDDQDVIYGDEEEALTYTVIGDLASNHEDEDVFTITRVAGDNVGTYDITLTQLDDNYNITSNTATYTIEKYEITGIDFDDQVVEYDGLAHKLEITGTLPEGVEVTYTPTNEYTEKGVYDIEASFTDTTGNYIVPEDMMATLEIYVSVKGISLNETSLRLDPNDTYTLVATLNPIDPTNDAVIWVSTDDSVVEVDQDGNLVALEVGHAVVVVTTIEGGFSAICNVEVSILPESVEITNTEEELLTTDVLALNAVVYPLDATYQNVTWTSSDTNIATVDNNGVVTPVEPGFVTITVETVVGGYKDTITIEIVQLTEEILLNRETASIVETYSLQLIATIKPNDTTDKSVIWSSSNETVATVDQNGLVEALSEGTTTITVNTLDGTNLSASCEITVTKLPVHAETVTIERTDSGTVLVDENVYLKAVVEPVDITDTITWATSDETIASVSQAGVVTALNSGTVTITAYVGKDTIYEKKATYEVEIFKHATNIFGLNNLEITYGTAYEFDPIASSGLTVDVKYYDGLTLLDEKPVNAGTYRVVASVESNYKYEAKEVEATLTINKVQLDKPLANANNTFTYNKENHTYTLETSDYYIITGNVNKNAGNYEALVTIRDTVNYEWIDGTTSVLSFPYVINKAKVNTPTANTGLVYNNNELTGVEETEFYDVEDGKATNADTYFAQVTLKDTSNYEWLDSSFDGRVMWSIEKAKYDMSGAYWSYTGPYTYDGQAHGVELNGLPTGVEVVYALGSASATNAGTYTARIDHFEYDEINYILINNNVTSFTWIINKQELDMQDVAWNYDGAFAYNGSKHTVSLTDVPSEITVTYTENEAINAGTYVAVATFAYDTVNYVLINNTITSFTWIINKQELDMQDVAWDYEEAFAYNGSKHTVTLENVPSEITVTYTENEATDAGTYVAVATFAYDTVNYELINNTVSSLTWKIERINETITVNDILVAKGESYSVTYVVGNKETLPEYSLPEGFVGSKVYDLSATGVHFEGSTGEYEGLSVDATNGKFKDNNGGWTQVNAGTIITFPITEGAEVDFVAYTSKDNFEVNVDGTTCTIEVLVNDYLKSITVSNPIVISSSTKIDLSATGAAIEGSVGTYGPLTVDATSGKFKDNNGGWVQVNVGTIITLHTLPNYLVELDAYTSEENFKVTNDEGLVTIEVLANDYIKTIYVRKVYEAKESEVEYFLGEQKVSKPTEKGIYTIKVNAEVETNYKGYDEASLEIFVKAQSVTLDYSSASVALNGTLKLNATVNPDDTNDQRVVWSSNNEAVATVDQEGNVTPVSEGEATITVTTVDGGHTATCVVRVTPRFLPATNVELSQAEDITTMKVGDTLALTATFTPADHTDNVRWTSSNSNIASVNNGVVTAHKATNEPIIITVEAGSVSATYTITSITKVEATITDLEDSYTTTYGEEYTVAPETNSDGNMTITYVGVDNEYESTTKPTDAGEYEILVVVEETTKYTKVEKSSVLIINKSSVNKDIYLGDMIVEKGESFDINYVEKENTSSYPTYEVVESTTYDLTQTDVKYQGNAGDWSIFHIDATTGKWEMNANGWVQVNKGTIITFEVPQGAQISYNAYTSSAFEASVVGTQATIKAVGNDYLKSITVTPSQVVTGSIKIDAAQSYDHFEGNKGTWGPLTIDATTGKWNNNQGGWIQVNQGTVITFQTVPGSYVSVDTYQNQNILTTNVDGNGLATITLTGNGYLNNIYVTAPKVLGNEGTVKFYNSNDEEVTPNANGTYKMVITVGEDRNHIGVTAEATLTVITSVTGVELNKEETTLAVDGTEKLTATITPSDVTNSELVWSTSDDTIVLVDQNGNITALQPGEATITVTTVDGGYTDTCVVTVSLLENTITAGNINTTYGEPYAVIFDATANKENAVVTYYDGGTKLDEKPTDAGTYKVVITVPATGTYAEVTKEVTLKINQRTIGLEIESIETVYGTDKELVYTIASGSLATGDNIEDVFKVSREEGTDVYTYAITVETLNNNYVVNYNSATYTIAKLAVDEPTVDGTYTYDTNEQEVVLDGYDSSYMTIEEGSVLKATDADTYTIVITLDSNHKWDEGSDGIITWTIGQATLDLTDVVWDYEGNFVYNGSPYTVELVNVPNEITVTYDGNTQTNAGENYTASATFEYDTNNYVLANNNIEPLAWKIAKATLTVDWTQQDSYTYGEEFVVPQASVTTLDKENDQFKVVTLTTNITSGQDAFLNAGSYDFVAVYDNPNYIITNTTLKDVVIDKAKVNKPVGKDNLVYNKDTQTGIEFDDELISIVEGSIEGTNAQDYTVIFELKDANNYEWADETIEDIEVSFTIGQLPVNEPKVLGTYTYNTTEQEVKLDGFVSEYMTITSGNVGKDAATYTVVITLDSNHTWAEGSDGNITWSIGKATLDLTDAAWNYDENTNFVYDGNAHTVTLVNVPNEITVTYDGNIETNAGENYTASATFEYDTNNYVLANNNVEPLTWKIVKADATVIWVNDDDRPYTGNEFEAPTAHIIDVLGNELALEVTMTTDGEFKDAKTYEFNASEKDTNNYNLIDSTTSIEVAKLTPTFNGVPEQPVRVEKDVEFELNITTNSTSDIKYTYYNGDDEEVELVDVISTTGTYTVVVSVDAATNYTSAETSFTLIVVLSSTGVSISEESIEINIKETANVTITVTPNGTTDEIVITSSNSNVATMTKEGVITSGLVTGETTITVTCGNYSDSIVVTVVSPWGTLENPISVETAIGLMNDQITESNVPSPVQGYLKGIVKTTPKPSQSQYSFELEAGENTFELRYVDIDSEVTLPSIGDEVVVFGYFFRYLANGNNKYQMGYLANYERGIVIASEHKEYDYTVEYNCEDNIEADIIGLEEKLTSGIPTIFAVEAPEGYYVSNITYNGEIITPSNGEYTITPEINNTIVITLVKVVEIESISIEGATLVEVEKSITLTLSVDPNDATITNPVWSVSDDTYATITSNGTSCVVTGVVEGNVTVTFKCNELNEPLEHNIQVEEYEFIESVVATFEFGENKEGEPDPENGFHSDGGDLETYIDGSYQLQLLNSQKVNGKAYDKVGNSALKLGTQSVAATFELIIPQEISSVIFYIAKYKANTSKININGVDYTLTKNSNDGEYDEIVIDTTSNKTISFTTVSGGYRCMINTIKYVSRVGTASVSGVTLNTNELNLIMDEEATLVANVLPIDAANTNVTWSSNKEEVATVNNGVVTAIDEGTATITVSTVDGGFTATCTVNVSRPALESVELLESSISMVVGDEPVQLTVTPTPGNASLEGINWRSDKVEVATVDQTGKVTAVGAGTAFIIVEHKNIEPVMCKVTVTAASVPVESVTIKQEIVVLDGTPVQLEAEVLPAEAKQNVTWTSNDTDVVKVDLTTGELTPVNGGVATVTATADGGKTATCTIVVPITGTASETISFVDTNQRVSQDTSKQVWSSNGIVLTNNKTSGSSNVVADVNPVKLYAKSEVIISSEKGNITKIEFICSSTSYATALNNSISGSSVSGSTVTIEYDSAVESLTISSLSAQVRLYSMTVYYEVSNIPLAYITLSKTNLDLVLGQDPVTLTPTFAPSTATNKEIIWESSDSTLVSVENGVVTPIGLTNETPVTITAKSAVDGNIKATCTVNVTRPELEGISLNKEEITLNINGGIYEDLEVNPIPNTALLGDVSWHSEDERYVTVDENGNITPIAVGTTAVVATVMIGGEPVTATCDVYVVNPVTSLSLNKSVTSIIVGQTETLEAIVAPIDAEVVWESRNTDIATVDENGKVTAVAPGEATITATAGTLTATCLVTVIQPVTGVTLSPTTASINVGQTVTLVATVSPNNASNKNVTWSSDNTSVATVSEGIVTAVSAGTATITATTVDGGKTATCSVTVNEVVAIEELLATIDFESSSGFAASTTYNNTSVKYSGASGKQWGTISGTPSTDSAISGSQSLQMRVYKSTGPKQPYTQMNYVINNVSKVTFKAKASVAANDVIVYYSIDGGTTWSSGKEYDLTTSSKEFTLEVATFSASLSNSVQLKFVFDYPSSYTDKSKVIIDDIKFYGLK